MHFMKYCKILSKKRPFTNINPVFSERQNRSENGVLQRYPSFFIVFTINFVVLFNGCFLLLGSPLEGPTDFP